MYGFQSHAARRLAQMPAPEPQMADGGVVPFGARGVASLRDMIPKMQAMGYQQAAPAPAAPSAAERLRAMIPQVEAMGYKQQPQYLARGGVVRGPGTGTSDSIETEAEPGTFIMPADSTKTIGATALEKLATVPVKLSNGEFEFPPEQVMAVGAAVLKLLKDTTHKPVNGEDGGQTDDETGEGAGHEMAEAMPGGQEDDAEEGMGYRPADRMAQMPPMMFADGGLIDNNVTRVGNSYSGGNVGGDVSFNGQSGGGTVSTSSWTSPAPASAPVATAAPTAQQPVAAAATPAATPAPAPAPAAPMGWAERNAMRNNQVTASSMVDSPERRAAQAALAPPPAPQPSTTATATAPVAGFQSAAQRLGTLPVPGQPQLGYQPRRYADGGTVQDEERAQRLAQLPSGEGNETRAAFGFYPQLAGGQRTSYATDQKLRSGVVATGPSTFEPAVNPAPPAPPAPVGSGDGRRMGATQDPRSLTFAGSSAPAPAPSSDGALGRAAAMASNLPAQTPAPQTGGPVSPQNESAASALSRRGAEEAMALMPNAPQLELRAPTVRHSGNDWASRKQLENLATAASSITNDQRWGGEGDKSLDRQALAQAQATDAVLQQAQPGLEAAAMRENADNMRAQMQARSAAAQAQSAERGAMDRTLITERGNNTRAGITALAGIEEARIKNNEGKPLTEDQAKSAGYALRMDNALKLINDIGSKDKSAVRPGVVSGLTNMLPEGAANMLRPEARQRVESAQLDALDAALTLNTGAAYTREQLQGLSRSYFAQPGDDDRTVADKQNRLNSLIQTARLRAGTKGAAMADSVQAKAAQQGGAQAQPVATQEAYAALPSGSRFVAPDGKVRIKP